MAITKINTPELFDLGSTNTALQLPTGTTAQRPTSPSTGQWRFNTDNNKVEYWDGGAWRQIDDEGIPPLALENFNTNTYVGNGATQTIDAKFNEAAAFNGSSSGIFISSTGNSVLNYDQDFSVSMWVYMTNYPHAASQDHLWTGGGTRIIPMSINTNGTVNVNFFNVSSDFIDSTTALSLNAWTHIVFTRSKTNGRTFYINNNSAGTDSYTGNASSISNRDTIGQYWDGSRNSFDGKIDQVRIFNTSLTSSQVSDLYNNETTTTAGVLNFPTGAGCVAAYQLDGDASDVGGTYGGVATDIGFVGLQFQPDLVWIKSRGASGSHIWTDSVRGDGKEIYSDLTNAEGTVNRISITSNGFELSSTAYPNQNGSTFVAWCWKAGGAAVSNTDGSITSQVSANQDAGFSIVSYTGNNGSNATIGHGLDSAPELIITKARNFGAGWPTMIKTSSTSFYGLRLNSSGANDAANGPGFYNNTAPTDSVYTVGGSDETNDGYNYVSYCFHSVDGYSKVGSYTGNGSTSGPIVETGFEPAFLMIKRTDSSANWRILDNKRSPINPRSKELYPNLSNAEGDFDAVDFLSNGFQNISTDASYNANGGNYIYLAIAAEAQPAPVLADSFEPVIYTGTGATQQIATDFKPDLIWFKDRGGTYSHALYNSVTGRGEFLRSNSTDSRRTGASSTEDLVSFDVNGFTLGTDYHTVNNANNRDYVAWCWKAAGVSTINNEGSITSITNANPAAGFSIVEYTAGGTATVGHGLSSAPEMIITKNLDISEQWFVYHSAVGTGKFLGLNTTSTATTNSGTYTNVGSTTFTNNISGTSRTYINYCFHSVDGYQKVGSYNGSGAAGNAQVLGFTPRWLMIKRYVGAVSNWVIFDTVRGDGTGNKSLYADLSSAEATDGRVNLTSTGFDFDGAAFNESSTSWIYLAIK